MQTDFIRLLSLHALKVVSSASRVASVLDMRKIYAGSSVGARFILRFFCVPHGRIWVRGIYA
jgi:hypothetical protein